MEKPRLRCLRIIAVTILLTLTLVVRGASGQEDRDQQSYQFFRAEIDRITNAKYRIGPFSIFPSIRFNLGYDNNVYRSNIPEFMINDYTARLSTPVSVYLRYKNWLIFSLTDIPEYVYYFKTSGLRGFDNAFSSQIRLLLINRFVISGSFMKSRIRRRVTFEFDTPIYENLEGFTGSISYELGQRLSLRFSSNIFKIRYGEISASQRLNRRAKSNVITLNYGFSSGSQFFFRGGYSQYSFQNVDISRDTDSYWFNAGIAFPLFGRFRGILSLGYSKVIPKDELWPDYSGMVGNTALEWSIQRFRFRINYIRNTSFSLGSELYFVNEGVGAGVSFFLTPSIRLGYDFNYNKARYPLPDQDNIPNGMNGENLRLDFYRRHSARIVFRLIRNTGIGIDVSYWERDSNIVGVSRKNTFVFLYLTTAFNL